MPSPGDAGPLPAQHLHGILEGNIQGRRLKALLLDLDGTLYFRGAPLPLAVRTVAALRSMGLALRFLTNTDSKSTCTLHRDLANMGFTVADSELFSAASAGLHFLQEMPDKRSYCLVSADLAPAFAPFHAERGTVDYVVVGDFRDSVSYEALNTAFRHVMAGAEIVALQKGRYFVSNDGYNLDTGALVALLEYASGKKAKEIGKPSARFFRMAIEGLGCSASEVAVVGDDVTTDIAGAQAVGALGVLVRTGKFSDEALDRSPCKPDFVVDSIVDVAELLSTIAG